MFIEIRTALPNSRKNHHFILITTILYQLRNPTRAFILLLLLDHCNWLKPDSAFGSLVE